MDFTTGHSEFQFPNGDKYVGSFEAHRSGLAWREGYGLYYTHDGHVYSGHWKDDKLDESEEIEILYANCDKYIGRLSKFRYDGPGVYIFANGGRLSASFAGNQPQGDILYVDAHGGCWGGQAGAGEVLLFQEHVFSADVDARLGRGGRRRRGSARGSVQAGGEAVEPRMSVLERRYFGKSTKTRSDIHFGESEWYREYELRRVVLEKVEEGGIGSLNDEESEWYDKYLVKEATKEELIRDNFHRSESNLLKLYFGGEWNARCPGVRVFYPNALYGCEE